VATRTETIHVSGIRCERCVGRLAGDALLAAMAKAGFRELSAAV
jgi:hypothetical protein